MKIDIDSLIYIIICIAILVISGLGGARRRRAQQLKTTANNSGPTPPGMNAMDRLERMFTGQLGYEYVDQTESPEDDEIMEEEPSPEEVTSEKEIQSRLDDKRISADYGEKEPDKSGEDEEQSMAGELFGDLDEIKKAVIYSEIFQRKYT